MAPVSVARYTALAVLFSLVWSSAFAVVKIALRDAPPLFLMASRFIVAGAVLLALAPLPGRRPPRPREWPLIAPLGGLDHSLHLRLTPPRLRPPSPGVG